MPSDNSKRDERICRYYARGFSLRETGAYFGLHFEWIRKIVRKRRPGLIRPVGNTASHSSGLVSSLRGRERAHV